VGQSVNIGQELLTVVPPNYLPSPRSRLRQSTLCARKLAAYHRTGSGTLAL
jgi:hypothetical protein